MVSVFEPPFYTDGVVVKKHPVTRPDSSVEDGFVVGVMTDDDTAKSVADALNFTERAGLFLIYVASELREAVDLNIPRRMADEIEEFTCG